MAASDGLPLYRWLAPEGVEPRLPVPHFNVINGGAHAQNALEFQEFMLRTLWRAVVSPRRSARAPRSTAALRAEAPQHGHGHQSATKVDLAPELDPPTAGELLVEAINAAGYKPGRAGVAIALDPAASGFFDPADHALRRGRRAPDQCRHDRALRRDGRAVPGLVDRGRTRRGRLGRMEGAHRTARRPGAARG